MIFSQKQKKEVEGLKILLMGKAKVGKTSMRSIIFANKAPEETKQLGFTENVNETHSKFLGKLYLDLYDCGGQEEFVKQYLESRRDKIFSDVGVLIFVVEAENYDNRNDDDHIEDLTYFEDCIKALTEFSPNAKIFVLIHKMDLVLEEKRTEVFNKRKAQLESKSGNFQIKCYPTSIWEASLYKAWTQIVSELSPNKVEIEKSLKNFVDACDASEVILFEKNTFLLCFAYSSQKADNINDEQRFEKISHIIKKFKLSCMSSNSSFKSMVIEVKDYSAYMDEFTEATYILVILADKKTSIELIKLNVALCKQQFEDKLNYSEKNDEKNDEKNNE